MSAGVVPIHTLPLHHGGRLRRACVGYACVGPEYAPVVVVLGGISASRDLAWWPGVLWPGCALDPGCVRLIGVDFLGGIGASTGPRTCAEPFPSVDPRDQARAVLEVLDALGVRSCAVVGASYGGQVALTLGAMAPDRVDLAVVLAAAHRPHALATAWRGLGRRIVAMAGGSGRSEEGVALARELAMLTYRSDRELDTRFAGGGLDEWLSHHGRTFARRFDAEAFTILSASLDAFRIEPETVRAPVALVGFDTDQLVPDWLIDELAARLPRRVVRWRVRTRHGHDGFLKEPSAVGQLLTTLLGGGEVAA
jgi:homoserine O-acetyltransferase